MRRLRRIRGWRAGHVAIEFAAVSTGLVMLLLGVTELSFILIAQSELDYVTNEAAQSLMTGSGGNSSATLSGFRTAIFCPLLTPPLTCSNVSISLTPVADFKAYMTANPLLINGQPNPNAQGYDPGQQSSLMMLEAYYTPNIVSWPIALKTIVSTAAFRNE